jgi:hypothetical protein
VGVNETLGAVIKTFPQARLVAFADLSSSMILASQGTEAMTQEHLDTLCRQARTSFDDPLFSLSVEAFGEPRAAVVLGADAVRVFLRSESEPADAMCCICDHGIDISAFLTKISETLDQVVSGG